MKQNSMVNIYNIIDRENKKYAKIYEKIGIEEKSFKRDLNPSSINEDKNNKDKLNFMLDR